LELALPKSGFVSFENKNLEAIADKKKVYRATILILSSSLSTAIPLLTNAVPYFG
jgi:hypothetical protein